jgi:hypothetical protein
MATRARALKGEWRRGLRFSVPSGQRAAVSVVLLTGCRLLSSLVLDFRIFPIRLDPGFAKGYHSFLCFEFWSCGLIFKALSLGLRLKILGRYTHSGKIFNCLRRGAEVEILMI